MTYEELVAKLQAEAAEMDASGVGEHVALQFNVTGQPEGALYIEVNEGTINVQPYEYHDRDALVTVGAEKLLDLVAGKQDFIQAYLTGKIKVEGNLDKAAKFAKIKKQKKSKKGLRKSN